MSIRDRLLRRTGAAALGLAALIAPAPAAAETHAQLGLGYNNTINSGYNPGFSLTGSVWNTGGPVGFHIEASASNEKKIGAENGYTYRTRGGATVSLGIVKLIAGVEWYGYRSKYANGPDLEKHTNVPFGGIRIEPESGDLELELIYLPPDTTVYKLRSLIGTLDFKMYEWKRSSMRLVLRGVHSIAGGRKAGKESGSFDGAVAIRF
jgi:hypothetical protein